MKGDNMQILLICGASGTGKSTIAAELSKDSRYNLVKSYTDRPMRGQELDHIFLDKQHMQELLNEDLVALTEIEGSTYCARFSQFIEDKINVYVVDVKGINDVIKSFPETDIMTVLITRKNIYIDENRKNRDIKIPSCDDVCVSVTNNEDIKKCVDTIKALVELNNGTFFKSNHKYVMSLEEKILYHSKVADYHYQIVQDCLEELKCMHYKE